MTQGYDTGFMTQGRGMPRPYMGMTNFGTIFSKGHKQKRPPNLGRSLQLIIGDPYWIRTSDLFPVKEAL